MKIRYCFTEKQKLLPCNIGWASYSSDDVRSCRDDPQEKNCHYLVDEKAKQTCPYCGNVLQKENVK